MYLCSGVVRAPYITDSLTTIMNVEGLKNMMVCTVVKTKSKYLNRKLHVVRKLKMLIVN